MRFRSGLRLALVLVLGCVLLPAIAAGGGSQEKGSAGTATTSAADKAEVHGTYTLSPEKLQRAIAYSRTRTRIQFLDQGWSALVLLLLLTTGAAAWMQRRALAASENRWVQAGVFVLLLLGVTTVLGLPTDAYGHHVALQYGQSVQRWPSWFGDLAKSFGLTYLIGVPLVMLLFWAIGRSTQRWWFWFWIPTVLATVIGVFVWPIFVDPLFNKFEPLAQSNPALVEQLEKVVTRGGINIPPDRMFLMKASAKVTGLNAYVTGVGPSKRVVVWDTSVQKATPEQISFIFGHEMGHYVLNHIYIGLAFSALLILVFFWVGYHAMQYLLRRFGASWGIADQREWSSLVVLLLIISVLSFVAEPVTSSFSRWEEHAADVYGQEAMHGILEDPQRTGAATFQLLGEESLSDPTPNPIVEFWTFSHPSVSRRMAFAAGYDPWVAGGSPRYFKR